ncbi:MAG: hypothetical protein FWD88_02475 [Treponema sp.]|nr:hypothetical protein [Treponema sp.]
MDVDIEFNESAFRHDIGIDDIRYALKTRVYDAALLDFPEKHAVIGFDRAGNALEILYNEIDDKTIGVFHAMKARKSFLAKLGLWG